MNEFSIKDKFDRVVSVEMIEHMRNHKKLFKSIASWLKPKGMFFMHIFVHQSQPYLFEVEGDDDWMSQYFFFRRNDAIKRPPPLLPRSNETFITMGLVWDSL